MVAVFTGLLLAKSALARVIFHFLISLLSPSCWVFARDLGRRIVPRYIFCFFLGTIRTDVPYQAASVVSRYNTKKPYRGPSEIRYSSVQCTYVYIVTQQRQKRTKERQKRITLKEKERSSVSVSRQSEVRVRSSVSHFLISHYFWTLVVHDDDGGTAMTIETFSFSLPP
jgi:hypothetical protein